MGDGTRTGRTCSPLSAYMGHAYRIRNLTGARTIYLATDSPEVLREAQAYADWTWLHMREALASMRGIRAKSASGSDEVWDEVLRRSREAGRLDDNRRVVVETTLDVLLLSLCAAFVGKHTSNFFRTAYELHSARCGCAAPLVSLDAPWCSDWGVFAGRSTQGRFPC